MFESNGTYTRGPLTFPATMKSTETCDVPVSNIDGNSESMFGIVPARVAFSKEKG